jgi:hypothetical protein
MELSELGGISSIKAGCGEHFVIHCDRVLSEAAMQRISELWEEFMPATKLLMLPPGLTLSVVKAEQ